MTLTPRLALMLTLPPLLWAGNAVLGRVAVAQIAPLWLNAMRWAAAFVLVLPLAWGVLGRHAQRRALWADLRQQPRYLLLLALTGVGLYNALQYLALATSSPLNVTLIASSAPVWTLLIGALFYRSRPQPRQLLGAALSLAGVAVVLGRGELALLLRLHLQPGDALMMGAIVAWSFYSWMLSHPPAAWLQQGRPEWARHWAGFLAVQMGLGLVWALLLALLGDGLLQPPLGGSGVLAAGVPAAALNLPLVAGVLVYVAIGPSLVAFRCWGLGVAQAGPALPTIFANLTPLFAALMSATLLGEWPRPYHGLAFGLIVAGIAVSSSRPAPSAPGRR